MSEQTKSTHEEKVLRIRALEIELIGSIHNPKLWTNDWPDQKGNNSGDIAAVLSAIRDHQDYFGNNSYFEVGGHLHAQGWVKRVYYDTNDYPRSSVDACYPGSHPDGIWKTFEEFRAEGYPEEYRLVIDTTRTYQPKLNSPMLTVSS